MNPTSSCIACGKSEIVVRLYEQDMEFKGVDLHLTGLEESVCSFCEYVFETHQQHDANIDKIRRAFVGARAAFKKSKNLLTGGEIRRIRKSLSLIQHDAADLFGGGRNAFSKYENEEIVQSVAMDKLVRLVGSMGAPGVELLRKASTFVPVDPGVLQLSARGAITISVVFDSSENLNSAKAIPLKEYVNMIRAPSTSSPSWFETVIGKNILPASHSVFTKIYKMEHAVAPVASKKKDRQDSAVAAKKGTRKSSMASQVEAKKAVPKSTLVSMECIAA